MSARLTDTQRVCLKKIQDGHWHTFAYGRFNVALRALHFRAPELINYEASDGEEWFNITDAGRAAVGLPPIIQSNGDRAPK